MFFYLVDFILFFFTRSFNLFPALAEENLVSCWTATVTVHINRCHCYISPTNVFLRLFPSFFRQTSSRMLQICCHLRSRLHFPRPALRLIVLIIMHHLLRIRPLPSASALSAPQKPLICCLHPNDTISSWKWDFQRARRPSCSDCLQKNLMSANAGSARELTWLECAVFLACKACKWCNATEPIYYKHVSKHTQQSKRFPSAAASQLFNGPNLRKWRFSPH